MLAVGSGLAGGASEPVDVAGRLRGIDSMEYVLLLFLLYLSYNFDQFGYTQYADNGTPSLF